MPRPPRFNLADIPQHIVQVGHNKLPCFFDDEDYQFFLDSLAQSATQYQCEIHAYLLLNNTVHIIATPRLANGLSSMMQSLGRRYVQYVNYRYQRSGTLWEGRYRSCLIDSEAYLLTCYRYIELKPLQMDLVDDLAEYPWSSYHHHVGLTQDPLIHDHPLYKRLGETEQECQQRYNQLFTYGFDPLLYEYIAETINVGSVLGGDAFKDKIEAMTNRRVRPLKRGRPKKNEQQEQEVPADPIESHSKSADESID